ncbi:unnamed protein product [Agarophyton chilense]
MAPTTKLPALNQRVFIWFDGYDEFYPGRVANLTPPFEFKVVLEDGTDWDIDSRKHVYKFSDDESEADPKPEEPSSKIDTHPKIAEKEKDEESEKQVSADDQPEPNGAQTRRRAGRALRKNATPTRNVVPDVVAPEERDEHSQEESHNDDYIPKEDDNEQEDVPRLRRSARVADEDRERRTTRSRAKSIEEPVGLLPRTRKRTSAKRLLKPNVEDGRATKRRKQVEEPMDRLDDEPIREENGVSALSTKAVTAIAVQAALESAKAVLKPLSDKMSSIVTAFTEINNMMKRSAEAAAREAVKKAVHKPEASKGTVAALANFQLDFAEVVGGGEARMKAHSKLSENEFNHISRMIQYQGKALQEVERLLYAAKEFSKKPVVEEPIPQSNGKEVKDMQDKESEKEKEKKVEEKEKEGEKEKKGEKEKEGEEEIEGQTEKEGEEEIEGQTEKEGEEEQEKHGKPKETVE